MFKIDDATAIGTIPTPAAAGAAGFFTDGDPSGSVPATVVSADWLNAVQEEMCFVVTDSGATLSKTDRTQLKTAIDSIVSTAIAAANTKKIEVRQTAVSSAVDSSGYASYITIGTGLAVNLAATSVPVILTASNGSDSNGQVDRVGSISADTTIGSLTGSTTNYLYADIAANGTVTLGATTLAPVYQFGGTYSVTSGQFTYNIQEMVGKVGNGSSAVQTYRVFIGEAVTGVSTVTSVVNYALNGRYRAETTVAVATTYTFSSNIGVYPQIVNGLYRQNNTYGWAAISSSISTDTGQVRGIEVGQTDRNTCKAQTGTHAVGPSFATFAHASSPTTGDVMILAYRAW